MKVANVLLRQENQKFIAVHLKVFCDKQMKKQRLLPEREALRMLDNQFKSITIIEMKSFFSTFFLGQEGGSSNEWLSERCIFRVLSFQKNCLFSELIYAIFYSVTRVHLNTLGQLAPINILW